MGREPLSLRISPLTPLPCGNVVLCGISTCFQVLSPSKRQVVHALLTRSPLTRPRRASSVRLACVRHAASVRPEPGSNSLLNPLYQITAPKSNYLISFFNAYASLNYLCFQKYVFFIPVRFSPHFSSKKSLRFLTSFCSYYCSIFKVLLFSNSLSILSQGLYFVKHFFRFIF